MDFCPGGGKLSIGYKGRIETCDTNKLCTGKAICNPHVGVCCSKLRICPWPKSPLLEGFTHKPLICRFRGTSAISCPTPSYCEEKSGFCCAETNPQPKKPNPPTAVGGGGPAPPPMPPIPSLPNPRSRETFTEKPFRM
uniref:Uncharacterized protein n=1 Tax=Panagrolaimus superbus TaxID=310955 RepID=A0A914YHK1_9BILA